MKQEPVAWIKEAEEIYDDLCMSWQSDMENGVKSLNEKAVEDFKKNYPALNVSISRTMQFLNNLADSEYTEPQYRELSDEEIADATKAWFNIHPDAEWRERFEIKLYDLEHFARAILKKASEK